MEVCRSESWEMFLIEPRTTSSEENSIWVCKHYLCIKNKTSNNQTDKVLRVSYTFLLLFLKCLLTLHTRRQTKPFHSTSAVTLSLSSSFSIIKKCPMAICEIRVQGSGYTRHQLKGAAAFALLQALKPCASCCVLQSPHICPGPLAGSKSGPHPTCSHSQNKLTFTSNTETDYSDIWDQFNMVWIS